MFNFIIYYVVALLMVVNGKTITVQIDSEDFLEVFNNLANFIMDKNPTVRSDSTRKPEAYRNPYHPEDDINETEKDGMKAYKNTKDSKNLPIEKKNDEVNAKIDQDNKDFLESGNSISDDELTDNNTNTELKIIQKNSWKNFTLKEKELTPKFSKRFIKKY